MRRHRSRLFALLLALVCAVGLIAAPQKTAQSHDAAELQAILEKCAVYCRKLENAVLYFVCKEKLVEELFEIREGVGNLTYAHERTREFLYDYQLVRTPAGRMEESRTLLKENGEAREEKGAKLETVNYLYKNIVLSPVDLLSKDWQAKYDYQVVGEKRIRGRKAIAISATPKPGTWTGNTYGTIWVGQDDYSILKIEWSPDSVQNIGRVKQSAWEHGFSVEVVLTGEYGFENNGIRFPSEFSVNETRSYLHGSKVPCYALNVDYSAYKFFTVETEVKY